VTANFDELFDQRRHRRVQSQGSARVNFGGRWHGCEIVDVSGGGARFRSEISPLAAANVLVQLRGLGMVRAKVVMRNGRGFAVQFNAKDYDQDALVDSLMLQANAKLLAGVGRETKTEAAKPAPRPGDEMVRALRTEGRGAATNPQDISKGDTSKGIAKAGGRR
jgi:hypothetical protein